MILLNLLLDHPGPPTPGEGVCVCVFGGTMLEKDWINLWTDSSLRRARRVPLIRVSLSGTMVLFPKGGCKLRINPEALGSALR